MYHPAPGGLYQPCHLAVYHQTQDALDRAETVQEAFGQLGLDDLARSRADLGRDLAAALRRALLVGRFLGRIVLQASLPLAQLLGPFMGGNQLLAVEELHHVRPEQIFVFGSRARGEAGPQQAILILDPQRPLHRRLAVDPSGGCGGQVAQGAALHSAVGQAGQEDLAVGLGLQPPVQHHHHAAVVLAADEAAEPLAEAQHGLGHLVLVERIVIGSLGTLNGRRAMTRQLSASPTTSIPSQKLRVPRRTARGVVRKLSNSCRREPSRLWP